MEENEKNILLNQNETCLLMLDPMKRNRQEKVA